MFNVCLKSLNLAIVAFCLFCFELGWADTFCSKLNKDTEFSYLCNIYSNIALYHDCSFVKWDTQGSAVCMALNVLLKGEDCSDANLEEDAYRACAELSFGLSGRPCEDLGASSGLHYCEFGNFLKLSPLSFVEKRNKAINARLIDLYLAGPAITKKESLHTSTQNPDEWIIEIKPDDDDIPDGPIFDQINIENEESFLSKGSRSWLAGLVSSLFSEKKDQSSGKSPNINVGTSSGVNVSHIRNLCANVMPTLNHFLSSPLSIAQQVQFGKDLISFVETVRDGDASHLVNSSQYRRIEIGSILFEKRAPASITLFPDGRIYVDLDAIGVNDGRIQLTAVGSGATKIVHLAFDYLSSIRPFNDQSSSAPMLARIESLNPEGSEDFFEGSPFGTYQLLEKEFDVVNQLQGNIGIPGSHSTLAISSSRSGKSVVQYQDYYPYNLSHLIDLFQETRKMGIFEEEFKKVVFTQIAQDLISGLNVLRERGIQHGDIKPENILIFKDQNRNYRAAISDFGTVHCDSECNDPDEIRKYHGNQFYISPESARWLDKGDYAQANQNPKNDLWSLGLTLYQLKYGRIDFSMWLKISSIKTYADLEKLFQIQFGSNEPPQAGSFDYLVFRLLDPDPNKRPEVRTALQLIYPRE
jgi:hypothetical protein